MKKSIRLLLILLPFFIPDSFLHAQGDTLTTLFRNSYRVFELMRNDIGIYRDSKVFKGQDHHPSSIASTGMGLISLCIADEMGWEKAASKKALTTLKSITGNRPGFQPDRNAAGFYRHWIDMETGARAWDSEYSTIDTGILTSGALFCKKYFCGDDSIQYYVDLLWQSVNWPIAIKDVDQGQIYLTMEADGSGNPNQVTLPFNEYMIVAFLAMQQETEETGIAHMFWKNHYADPQTLQNKQLDIDAIPLLTDHSSHFLSSFVIQFPYYLCHYFGTDSTYLGYLSNARKADSIWWGAQEVSNTAIWGLGAGSDVNGYHADAIDNNPFQIFSPHIIAGFLPVYPEGKQDLVALYREGVGSYRLPDDAGNTILWRASIVDPAWVAPDIQGVDYSTMLFGLASLPEFLGIDFFPQYNNFFLGDCATGQVLPKTVQTYSSKLIFDPVTSLLSVSINYPTNSLLKLQLTSQSGKKIRQIALDPTQTSYPIQLDCAGIRPGQYYLLVRDHQHLLMKQRIIIK